MPGLIVGVGSVIQQQAYNLPMLAVRCTQQRIIAIIVLPILVHVFMQKVAHDLGMAFRRGSIQGAIVRTSEQHAFLFAGAKMCACSHQQLDGRQMPLFGGIDERGAVFPFRIGGDARVKQTPNLDMSPFAAALNSMSFEAVAVTACTGRMPKIVNTQQAVSVPMPTLFILVNPYSG